LKTAGELALTTGAAEARSTAARARLARDAAPPLLSVQDLAKSYQVGDVRVDALNGVTLDIAAGELVAIMGASGSGKSTFMNLLGCLDRPTSGRYRLAGVDVAALSADERAEVRNRELGFVFQSFNLLPRASALENTELPLFYGGADLEEQRESARAALAAVGLGGREHHVPTQLSGGQQQRVAIARALVGRPSLLLADEPTGNLDSHTSEEILAIVQRLNREDGITVVLVTHEPDVAAFAERVITFRDGRVLSDERQTPRTAGRAEASHASGPSDLAREERRDPSRHEVRPEPAARSTVRAGSPRSKLLRMTATTALRALARNKLRSTLTTLGIIIGVAAVIAMVSIGRGADEAVQSQIRGLGTDLLMIVPGATTSAGVRSGWGGVSTLSAADAKAIAAGAPAAGEVSYYRREIAQVVAGDRNWATAIQGSPPSFFRVRQWGLASGRAFTQREEDTAARVAVLGDTIVRELFGAGQDPIGARIRIKNVPFEVIGVLEPKGQTMWGQDQDDVILIPFSAAERRVLGAQILGRVDQIHVTAASSALLPTVKEQITTLLRQRHRIRPDEADDFTVRDLAEFARASQTATQVMTNLLLGVASISLLVGGIGIMNIMLVSVTERTREIGIRMAIGAKGRHIRLQFLVEAALLSFVGGVIGAAVGIGAAIAIAVLAAWPILVPPASVAGAVLFSAVVGVFFGFYPAGKASRLDPIAALRHE
jgi:macrolide transport system ATP-binding/permease protein